MKVYIVRSCSDGIAEFEADKVTEKSVYIHGRRRAASSADEEILMDRDSAVQFIRKRYENRIEALNLQLAAEQERFAKFNARESA